MGQDLREQDLKKFRSLEPDNQAGHWEALETLVDHLEDHWVVVDDVRLERGNPCRLAVFQARDPDRTPLYAVVTRGGCVTVGHTTHLKKNCTLQLHDFDPLWHEIVSMVVTGELRPLGERLDLWIVVRRYPEFSQSSPENQEPRTMAYHGMVWLDAEVNRPKLQPALDDDTPTNDGLWRGQLADRLPPLLSKYNICFTPAIEPFTGLARWEAVREKLPSGNVAEALVCTTNSLCFATAEQIRLIRHPNSCKVSPDPLGLAERIWDVALIEELSGFVRGIAGCDDRRLVAFTEADNGLTEAWSQNQHSFPVALAFLPAVEGNDASAWPDLLVAFGDGCAKRLRYCGCQEIRQLWQTAWEQLELADARKRIETAQRNFEQTKPRRIRAMLVGIVEGVLESKEKSPKDYQKWLDEVSALFRPNELEQTLSAGLDCLLKALRNFAEGKESPRPLPESAGDFLPALIHKIYVDQAQILDREQIDQAVQTLAGFGNLKSDLNGQKLIERSHRTTETIWCDSTNKKTLSSELERLIFGLRRWINTYALGYVNDFKGALSGCHLVGMAACTANDIDQKINRWLAVTNNNMINLYTIKKFGKLDSCPYYSIKKSTIFCGILQIATISNNQLLAVDISGYFYILQPHLQGRQLSVIIDRKFPCQGDSWVLASCRHHDGGALLAVVCNQERYSILLTYHYSNDKIVLMQERILDLPRIYSIDLAVIGKTGYRLIAVATYGAPACLYDLQRDGSIADRRWLHILKSGGLAACFSDAENPKFAIAGERSGFLWCFDLKTNFEVDSLRWVYRMESAVRSIARVRFNDTEHFLVGSEAGELCLFRACDGVQIWWKYLRSPIRQVMMLDGYDPLAIVLMSDGRVAAFNQIKEQKQSDIMSEVKKIISNLTPDNSSIDDNPWNHTDAGYAKAFYQITQQQEKISTVLFSFKDQDTRFFIIRYLTTECRRLSNDAIDIINHLSPKEWTLLLAYLPMDNHEWNQLIKQESKKILNSYWDNISKQDTQAAIIAFLNRLGHYQVTLKEFISYKIRDEYFNASLWIRLVFCLLLTKIVQRIQQETFKQNFCTANLFAGIFDCLFDLSPELSMTFERIFPFDSEMRKYCQSLTLFLENLTKQKPLISPSNSLGDLAGILSTQDHYDHPFSRIFSILVKLQHCIHENQKELWQEWRQSGLDSLKELAKHIYDHGNLDTFWSGIVKQLRAMLPKEPVLPDSEPLERRIRRIEEALRCLSTKPDKISDTNHPWHHYSLGLLNIANDHIRQILDHEHRYVSETARPRLNLRSCQLDANNRLRLGLEVIPEGFQILQDVTIQLDAEGSSSISLPGHLLDQWDILDYSPRLPARSVEFHGYIQPNQRTVSIRARLQVATGYESDESWVFNIPERPSYQHDPLAFSKALPQAYQQFRTILFESKEPLLLAVLDSDLGRDILLNDWDRQFPNTRVDLDTAVRTTGRGRYYGELELDLRLIQQIIETAIHKQTASISCQSPAQSPSAIMIAPIDELIQRLLDGEAPGLLEAWWRSLFEWVKSKQFSRLILLVSSIHACHLRRLGLEKIVEVAAHRLLLEEGLFSSRFLDSIRSELTNLVQSQTSLDEIQAQREIELLNWDLRWILRWLRQIKQPTTRNSISAKDFLSHDQVKDEIRAGLSSLEPYDLINALMGAETETVIERYKAVPGLVAAEHYRSTTHKHTPKLLQQRGTAFSAESLNRIDSDQSPPVFLRIQGFGTVGSSEAPRSRLLEIAQHRKQERSIPSFQRLARLGIGVWKGDIFRTITPYRELIHGLYDRFSTLSVEQRDSAVYAELLGTERSPMEAINFIELGDLPSDYLKRLMPSAAENDFRKLRALIQLYKVDSSNDVEPILRELFQPKTVQRLERHAERWDYPIVGIALPCFGVGQLVFNRRCGIGEDDPKHYLFWVATGQQIDFKELHQAIGRAINRRNARPVDSQSASSTPPSSADFPSISNPPSIFVMGPGTESLKPDPERSIAVLRLADACRATWEGNLEDGLWRKLRSQLRLSAISPFRTSGALPPGSPIFKGREQELAFIKARLRQASILIIGGRRVGKTSLLNQVYDWTKGERDLEPIYVDLQGVTSRPAFQQRLIEDVEAFSQNVREVWRIIPSEDRGNPGAIATAVRQKHNKIPLFLFNEIDGLVVNDPDFVGTWRSLSDTGQARFLMVGYSAISRLSVLNKPDSPFFHFTEGTNFGNKAIALTALSPSAAEQLLTLLETSELGLRWQNKEQREKAFQLLIEKSYRIPWVLQSYGKLLVEHLEKDRRDTLALDDVKMILKQEGRLVWQYINNIDYSTLGYHGKAKVGPGSFRLILFALARQHYFIGGEQAPIRDPRLRERPALAPGLGFTVAEVQEAVQNIIERLLLGREQTAFEQWFADLDLDQTLQLLTLTLALEPDPFQSDRYGFLLHIVPLELYQEYGEKDPTLDDCIVNEAISFIQSMRK